MKQRIFALCIMMLLAMPGLTAFASESRDNNVEITVVMPTVLAAEEQPPTPSATTNKPILYPVSVVETRDNGRREIIRVYELGGNENPDHIPREAFEREGFYYELAEITRSELLSFDSREHIETITVNTDTKELETVLKLLNQTMEYQSEDGYIGVLTLDVSTIVIEPAGTRTNTSTASRTREYPHLSSNDLSLVPKTITEGKTTYNLANVDWRSGNTEAINYTELPQSYTAVATYSATVSSTSVTGYNSTAEYKGVLSRTSQDKMQYTANFIGVPIVTPVVIAPAESEDAESEREILVTPDEQEEQTVPSALADEKAEEDAASVTEIQEAAPAENTRHGLSPVLVVFLLVAVGVVAYCAGKFGKHFFEKFLEKISKPLCFILAAAVLGAMPQTALANDFSALPGYVFGGTEGETTLYFNETQSTIQPDFIYIQQDAHLSLDGGAFNYSDGDHIGKLTVERLGKTINIYEGESLASMGKGGGHFSFTGMNSGNTAIIGHNRGNAGYFIFVKDLREGDILTLDIGGIVKTYAVSQLYTVPDTDFSPLMPFGDHRLTLVTCLENQRNMRRIAVALEI